MLSLESFKALYVSLLDFILLGFKATAISSPTKVVGATEVGDGDSSFPSLSKRGKGKRLLGASGKSHPPTSTAQPADEDEDAIRLFMKLMAYLFLFFSLIIPLVLLPINSKGGKELGGLAGMTITNIDPSSTAAATSNDNAQASFYVAGNPVFWAHVTMSYILVLPTLVLVFFLYSSTARLRHKYLIRNALNPQILNGKILLVRDIPPNTSATALYQYFHRIFPGKIIQVNLDQNEGQLFAVQQQLEYHRNKLETAITTYMIRLSKYLHKKRGLIRQPTVPTIDASDEPDSITKETAPKEYHPRPSTNSMVGSTVVLDGFQDNDGNTYKMETITGPPPPDTRASSSIVQSSRFEESGNEADETNDNNPRTATLRSAGSISSIRMDGEELRLKKLLRPRHLKSIFNLNFIDTIDYNIDCIEKLKHQKSNIMINQPNYLSTWAFVVFNDVAACRLAYRGVCFQSNPLKGSTNHGDFDPEKDLIWKSLSISPYSRILRTTGSFLSITAITVFWGVLTAAITSSLSFESLSLVFPWLQKATDQNTVIASFLKGVAPTIAIFILLVS